MFEKKKRAWLDTMFNVGNLVKPVKLTRDKDKDVLSASF